MVMASFTSLPMPSQYCPRSRFHDTSCVHVIPFASATERHVSPVCRRYGLHTLFEGMHIEAPADGKLRQYAKS